MNDHYFEADSLSRACYRSRFLHPNRADCVMAIAERDRERAHA